MKMGSRAKKKVRILPQDIGDEDRISRLPDELLHQILSSLDAKVAFQTSILCRRWKPVWRSLPFLNFGRYEHSSPENVSKFIRHVLSKRNHQSHVSQLSFCVNNKGFPRGLIGKFVEYAISHNVESLSLELLDDHKPYKLSTFSSKSLKKLELRVYLLLESDCWDLPALTTLHLGSQCILRDSSFKNPFFTCLPALRTLCLENWIFLLSSISFSSPAITTLHLSRCSIWKRVVWDFPALTSLELHDVNLPNNMSDIISALVNLKNLTLFLQSHPLHFFISCPQVLNLSIRAGYSYVDSYNIEVSASKLCNFTFFSIFTARIRASELQNVNIRLQDWFHKVELTDPKQVNERLINMLPGLGNAKNLTFDLDSIEALNEMSDLLVGLPSPFCKLKYVELPRGFKESSMSSALRSFLLGASPKATIVTKLPRNDVNPRIAPVPLTHQHIDGKVIQAGGGLVQGYGGLVQNISGASNDSASSSRRNNDVGLWKGHEVNSEFVVLLDRILKKYPETFEHFTTKSKKICTMKLNMLCTSVNVFTSTTMTEIDTEMITEYRTLFSDLQRSFDVKWLVSRLNYIEQLHLSQHELHASDSCIDEDFGTMGAKLAANASYIGNGLLSDP